MDQIFDFLFSQYSSYSSSFIYLESFAVIMNITSVIYAKQNNILVYPTGLIGTGIFVYILFNFSLLGDMIINGYFFFMSIYGWYYWSRKKDKVFINNLQVETIIGIFSWEREVRQVVSVDLVMDFDNKKAAKSDDIKDALYKLNKDMLMHFLFFFQQFGRIVMSLVSETKFQQSNCLMLHQNHLLLYEVLKYNH